MRLQFFLSDNLRVILLKLPPEFFYFLLDEFLVDLVLVDLLGRVISFEIGLRRFGLALRSVAGQSAAVHAGFLALNRAEFFLIFLFLVFLLSELVRQVRPNTV